MLTKKQIEALPKGEHSNTKLSKMFESHCKPAVGRKQFTVVKKKSDNSKDVKIELVVKNRKQRRAK